MGCPVASNFTGVCTGRASLLVAVDGFGAVLGQLLVDEAWWRPHLLGAVAEVHAELVDEVAERLPTRRHAADRLTPKDVPVALLEQRLLN